MPVRLERSADAAEADSQRLAAASLLEQPLRAAEVRVKLGGVGGYATPRSDKGNGAPVSLVINLSGGHPRLASKVRQYIVIVPPSMRHQPICNRSARTSPSVGGTSTVLDEQDEEADFDLEV